MSRGLLFWILMIFWFIWGLANYFGEGWRYYPVANLILFFILFTLLGWKVFGPPLHD